MTNGKMLNHKIHNLLVLFMLLAAAALGIAGCPAEKAQPVYRVGILCGLDYMADTADGFKKGMAELGYVEGKNITYDFHRTNFQPEKEERILKTFVAEKVDLILTFPTEVSIMAKKTTQGTNIPVLFADANIEGTGLVDSIPNPGGNITGVRYPGPDLAVKRFEIMLDLVPQAKRLWIPYQRGYPIVASQLALLYKAAAKADVRLVEFPASDAQELRVYLEGFSEASDIGMDAILFVAEPLSVTPDAFGVLGKFAAEHHLPIGGALMSVDGYESLFGVHVKTYDAGEKAAVLADKIFKGRRAGTIPVVSAERHIVLNYKAASKMGLEVREGLLRNASEINR